MSNSSNSHRSAWHAMCFWSSEAKRIASREIGKSFARGVIVLLCVTSSATPNASFAAAASQGVSATSTLNCDDSMKTQFRPDANTTVLLVEKVKKGDPFPNSLMEHLNGLDLSKEYEADLCHVKLLVGPGNPGPADAPSTSRGIGIEVWLPEKAAWNQRFHALGNSGSTGSEEAIFDKISSWTGGLDVRSAPRVAAQEGAVTSTQDSGKGPDRSDSFLFNPDGSPNTKGLRDWTYRGLYEQATKTKSLATAYYGSPPKYSYFDGASGGGWQGFRIAQKLPDLYDGISSGVPALNWLEMVANLYPAIVIQRDLGGKTPSAEQLDLVSNAAIRACDLIAGQHLGFVIDNRNCHYDPTKDPAVLCSSAGGKNITNACVTSVQAKAINKFWYGMTRDGSAPDPAIDNGWKSPQSGLRLWYGQPRGTDLKGWARIGAVPYGADMFALVSGDIKFAAADVKNATGNGQQAWKEFTYQQLANAFEQVKAAETKLDVEANNPDLNAFKARGGKLIDVTHANDTSVISQGGIDYYERVVKEMGGIASVQTFFRLYYVPGLAHGDYNGSANSAANPPVPARRQIFNLLVDWVEKGIAPNGIMISSAARQGRQLHDPPGVQLTEKSLMVCPYPAATTYLSGDIFRASSYACK